MASNTFAQLQDFIRTQMRMSHIYQPLMLRLLLQNGGRASIHEIAAAFLAEDQSQLEYYEEVTKRMPVRVLRSHGVISSDGKEVRLSSHYKGLSEPEIEN